MVAYTLHDSRCTGVAHAEAFAYPSVDVHLAGSCAVEQCIARNGVPFRLEVTADGRLHGYQTTTQSLAEVVICFPLEAECNASHQECTERLPGRAFELQVQGMIGQSCRTVFSGYDTAQHCTYASVGIGDGIFQ